MQFHVPFVHDAAGRRAYDLIKVEVTDVSGHEAPIALTVRDGNTVDTFRSHDGNLYTPIKSGDYGRSPPVTLDEADFPAWTSVAHLADVARHPLIEHTDIFAFVGQGNDFPRMDCEPVGALPALLRDTAANTILIDGTFHRKSPGPVLVASPSGRALLLRRVSSLHNRIFAFSPHAIQAATTAVEVGYGKPLTLPHVRIEGVIPPQDFHDHAAVEAFAYHIVDRLTRVSIQKLPREMVEILHAARGTFEEAWAGLPGYLPHRDVPVWPYRSFDEIFPAAGTLAHIVQGFAELAPDLSARPELRKVAAFMTSRIEAVTALHQDPDLSDLPMMG